MTKEKKIDKEVGKLFETWKKKTMEGLSDGKVNRIIDSVGFIKGEDLVIECISIKLNTVWAVDRSRSDTPTYSTEKAAWSHPLILGNETDSDLFQMIQDLIERTNGGIGPLEMKAIEILSKDMLKELQGRLSRSEEQKTKRNKLIRYLRTELEQLKK